MGVSQQHDPAPYRDHVDSFTTAATSVSNSSRNAYHDETDNEDDNANEDSSVCTAINDSNSNTPHLRLLDPAPVEDEQWVRDSDTGNTSDEDDPVHTAPSEKPVTWSSLPKKGQLAILTIARLSEPLTQTSLQAYLFYQLRSFDPSLPDSTISKQAGILQGSFTAAQFLTAVVWGRLADSEWIGRKRVLLIGLLGTCISCLGFGFSRSFAAAAVFRTLGGALNSNAGVMRTMISESIEEKKCVFWSFLFVGTLLMGSN